MSKYEELATVLTEEQYLVEALEQLGYKPEVHKGGAALCGYLGDERPEKAHVIVRRQQLNSASNDIGFARDAQGQFSAVVSDYDRGIGFDQGWVGRVAQVYKECQTMAVAKSRGYVFLGRSVLDTPQGKKVQLRFAVR
jgi:hypothetical protein